MSRYIVILTILTLLSSNIFGKAKIKEMTILELINEEIHTLNKIKNPSAKLQYRQLELLAEKLKIVHTEENKFFIANSSKYKKKSSFFKKTNRLYRESLSFGKQLLRKFKKGRYVGPVYYTLALNSRDFGHDNLQYKYLKLALKNSRYNRRLAYSVNVSLAEYYYNSKKYKLAVKKYKGIIRNQEDEWLTKNLLNYGWCLFKTQKFKSAMQEVENAFLLSEREHYINVSTQAMQALISFYVFGNDINRGVTFIKKHSKHQAEHLFKLAKKSSGKGFYDNAIAIMNYLTKTFKDSSLNIEFHVFLLSMYKQYQKKKLFNEKSIFLSKLKLNKENIAEVTDLISGVIKENQIILKKNYDGVTVDYDKKTLQRTISLFNTLEVLHPTKRSHYLYLTAETYFSIGLYRDALSKYKTIFIEKNDSTNEKELYSSMQAIYYSIDKIEFSKDQEIKELEFAYTQHLLNWPKKHESNKVYPKFIALKFEQEKYDKSYNILVDYKKNYPEFLKDQQKLFKILFRELIEKKNTEQLTRYIAIARSGSFQLGSKFINTIETNLAALLFKQFDLKRSQGDYQTAIKGFQDIYLRDAYPKSVRSEAAFQTAMIFHQDNQFDENVKWILKSFQLFTLKAKNKKRAPLEKLALKTAYLQQFLIAEKYNELILNEFCSQKKQNNKVYEKLIEANLANNYTDKAVYNLNKYKSCISQGHKKQVLNIGNHLYTFNHLKDYKSFVIKHFAVFSEKQSSFVISNLENYYWQKRLNGTEDSSILKAIKKYSPSRFNKIVSLNKKFRTLKSEKRKFLNNSISFSKDTDIEIFMQKLQKRLNAFNHLVQLKDELLNSKEKYFVYYSYREFISFTQNMSKELKSYLEIKSADDNLNKQFHEQLTAISQNFNLTSQKLNHTMNGFITRNEVLFYQKLDKDLPYYTYDLKGGV